jgi:hypothetical protein
MVIFNCNQERLDKQKQYLKHEILNGNNKSYFKVIDLECGTGKSISAEEALATTTKKVLFVRERTEDCDNSAKRINDLAKKIIAKSIHSKNTKAITEDLLDFPVIVITHEKYKELSINPKAQKLFSKGRNILIIDEFLNMAKGNELFINKEFINSFETLLGNRTLRDLFAELLAEIEDYLLLPREKNSFFNSKTDIKIIDKKISKLKTLIRSSLTKGYCKSINYTKNELCKKIDNIKNFYKQTCVVEGNTMYCVNLDYQYWFLDNNIILDGSGNLNMAYKLNPETFHLQKQAKVLNYSKWDFEIMKTNSTSTGKRRALNFYFVINNIINDLGVDNTLYIGNIDDEKSVTANYINHFGNVTGSNEYMDLQNILIGHNPNIPFRMYILEYIYFSKIKYTNTNSWDGIVSGANDEKVYRFKEKQFEEYRQCRNANEIYQAIKRINRNMSQESKVIILNNDIKMINRIMKMFKNTTVTYTDSEVEYEKTKMDEYNQIRKKNSYAMKFIQVCNDIQSLQLTDLQHQKKNRKGEVEWQFGYYSKKKLCEYIKVSPKHFSQLVLNNVEVLNYFKRHNIKPKGQIIDFSNVV